MKVNAQSNLLFHVTRKDKKTGDHRNAVASFVNAEDVLELNDLAAIPSSRPQRSEAEGSQATRQETAIETELTRNIWRLIPRNIA